MYWLEHQDIMVLIRSIIDPPDNLSLNDHVTLSWKNGPSGLKLHFSNDQECGEWELLQKMS